ncbi:hypothetical protein [Plantactinospora sp. BC1]|uniref:hypothetical protein n=1 Tax=Plantactinospora sp. BC1 TaxID=2108470 RepID=UPI00131F426F|nr:hypothetical protein [Plantactinospora sp. BC1]
MDTLINLDKTISGPRLVAAVIRGSNVVRLSPRLRTAMRAARAGDRRVAPTRSLAVADPLSPRRVRHIGRERIASGTHRRHTPYHRAGMQAARR